MTVNRFRDGEFAEVNQVGNPLDDATVKVRRADEWDEIWPGNEFAMIDNFEDSPDGVYGEGETLEDYYSTVGDHERQLADVPEGEYGLYHGSDDRRLVSYPGDGLPEYPDASDTIVSLLKYDADGNNFPGITRNHDPENERNNYGIYIRDGDIRLRKGGSEIAESSESIPDEFVWVELDGPYNDNDTVEARIYELNGVSRGDEIVTLTATDDDYKDFDGFGMNHLASNDTIVAAWIGVLI